MACQSPNPTASVVVDRRLAANASPGQVRRARPACACPPRDLRQPIDVGCLYRLLGHNADVMAARAFAVSSGAGGSRCPPNRLVCATGHECDREIASCRYFVPGVWAMIGPQDNRFASNPTTELADLQGKRLSGSDGTRTRDLRRDRPGRVQQRPATNSSEWPHLQVLFALSLPRVRTVEPIVPSTFGPRVGHEVLSSVTTSRTPLWVADVHRDSSLELLLTMSSDRQLVFTRHDPHQFVAMTDTTQATPSPRDRSECVRTYCADTLAFPESR